MPGRSSRAGWDKHAGLVQWLRPEAGAFCSLELDRDRFPGAGDVDRLLARVRDGGTSVALARAQHPAWIAMAADNHWRVKVRWVTPLGLVTASIR